MCIYFSFLDLSCSVAATLGVLSAERVAVKAPGTLAVSQPALVLLQSPYNNPQPNTRPHKLAALTADGAHLQPLLGWALINENKYFSSATREAWSGGGVALWCGVFWHSSSSFLPGICSKMLFSSYRYILATAKYEKRGILT